MAQEGNGNAALISLECRSHHHGEQFCPLRLQSLVITRYSNEHLWPTSFAKRQPRSSTMNHKLFTLLALLTLLPVATAQSCQEATADLKSANTAVTDAEDSYNAIVNDFIESNCLEGDNVSHWL